MPEKFESNGPQARIERMEEKLEREKLELHMETLLKDAVESRLIDPVNDRAVITRLALIKKNGRQDLKGLKANVAGFEEEIQIAQTFSKSVEKLRSWSVTIEMGNELRKKAGTYSFDERVSISVELKDFVSNLDTLRTIVDGNEAEGLAIFTAIGAKPAKNAWDFELSLKNGPVHRPVLEEIREQSNKLEAVLAYREAKKAEQ